MSGFLFMISLTGPSYSRLRGQTSHCRTVPLRLAMAGVQRGVFALVGPFKFLSLVKSPSHPDGAAHAASVRPLTWVIDSRSADDKRTFEGSARARTRSEEHTSE